MTIAGLAPARAVAAGPPGWSPAVSLIRCPSLAAPHVVFPASDPFHAAGQGAILWSGEPADCGAAAAAAAPGVGIAEFEPDHTLGAPHLLPLAGGSGLAGLSAVTATGDGRIVLAGNLPAAGRTSGAGAGGGLSQGLAGQTFATAGRLGGPSTPIAVTSSYRGDVGVASVGTGGRIELRIEQHGTPSFGPAVYLSSGGAAITALSVNIDYRGDAVVAWAERGAIYVRVRASTGVVLPVRRVAASPPAPGLAALISDDNRAIVAWENTRPTAGHPASTTTSVYLDISIPGIHFPGPRLLDRFVDPRGVTPPAGGLQMVRLAYEGVVVVWTGLLGGHLDVRAASVSIHAMPPASTVSDPGADAVLSGVATGPRDDLVLLWTEATRSTGAPQAADERIVSARGVSEPSGTLRFDAPQLVAGPDRLSSPSIGIDPLTDVAVAVWRNQSSNPGIDYAVRGPSAADTSVAGRPGTPHAARRAGSGGPPVTVIALAAGLALCAAGIGLLLWRARGRSTLTSGGRRLTRRTGWDS